MCNRQDSRTAVVARAPSALTGAEILRERSRSTLSGRSTTGARLTLEGLRKSTGSGTVLGLSLVATSFALALAILAVGNLVLVNQRLQLYADEIALSAEDALRGISNGFPCEIAQAMSDRFGILLDTCRILNSETWIAVKQSTMGILLSAKAHATT